MSETTPSSVKRSRTEALELIAQVRRRACLWDRACAGYRNRVLRDHAWRDVCRALHPDYAVMSSGERHEIGLMTMRKWYNIRDAYKKSYMSKGSLANSSRPYLYADLLTFLVPIFEGKAKSDPIKYEAVDVDDDDQDQEREEWLNVFELDQVEATPPKRSKPDTDHHQPKERTETDDNILSVLVNLIEKEEDEDRAFFRSITPAVKSLPDEVKFQFRIRVMKLLNTLKKENKDTKTQRASDGESDIE